MASPFFKLFLMCLMTSHNDGFEISLPRRRYHGPSYAMHLSPTARPNSSGNSKFVEGVCKWFDSRKGFGFVQYKSEDIFLPASEIVCLDLEKITTGAKLSFIVTQDKSGRSRASKVKLSGSDLPDTEHQHDSRNQDTVSFKCFSMSQPFASLLMKGHKTIETRNSDIFDGVRGEVLLHVGRRPWPDKSYLQR